MAKVQQKKAVKLKREEQIKQDALELAQLIYDIYKEKKLRERKK
jgi:hypothetical protein